MTSTLTNEQIKSLGRSAGLDLVGIAHPHPFPYADYFQQWLCDGRHAHMHYLARNVEKRLDLLQLVPYAQSVICAAVAYYPGDPPPDTAAIARYAWRPDYHSFLKDRLGELCRLMQQALNRQFQYRIFVDTAPLMEKYYAWQAGLGWIGKNTLLINQTYGSWLMLGELVTDLPLSCDQPQPDRCGHCQHCLTACPTDALTAPRHLDARRCLSYQTVEAPTIDPSVKPYVTQQAFGCDRCQQACPYNKDAAIITRDDWPVHPNWQGIAYSNSSRPDACDTCPADINAWKQRFKGSCLDRITESKCNQLRTWLNKSDESDQNEPAY